MSKYVFFNMSGWGHVNPTLAVVKELVNRGHEVTYYLTEEFRSTIEATGASFYLYDSKVSQFANGSFSVPAGGIGGIIALDKDYVPPQIIDHVRATKPDVIVYDFMCLWAKQIIDELQVPAISLRATYASNEHFNLFEHMKETAMNSPAMREFAERMRAGMEQNAQTPEQRAHFFRMFLSGEELNIVFMPKAFQPKVETFDERYLFVGSSILPRHQVTDFPFEKLKQDVPLLYISMGSIATNQPELYKQCFEAFGEKPLQVVLAIGKFVDQNQLGEIPSNFILSTYVPQLEILPRTSVFVTHAGTNSIIESLSYGVPMVLIPQQPEQFMHARRTVDLGLGVQLNKEAVTATALREAVEQVMNDPSYRQQAQKMQQEVANEGGYKRAVDAIVEFTGKYVAQR